MSDMFGETIEKREERVNNPKYRKTEFLKLDEGERTVRIIEPRETRHYAHYIGWAYIKCLGDECPICQNNKKILYEHPEDYRDVKGWNPRRDRYYINVMDLTKAKVCPKCETEGSVEQDLCPACGTVLGDAQPLNKIKVLSGSSKLFEDLKVLSKTVKDDDDNRVDIRTYNWLLLTRGKGRDKVTTPNPRYNPAKAGILEFNAEDLFDLENAVITLTPEEMLDVYNGAPLKDIFAVRRANKKQDEEKISLTDDAELEESLNSIFKE